MYYLRALKELVFPLNLALIFFTAAAYFLWRARRKPAFALLLSGIVVLVALGTSAISGPVLRCLEKKYPTQAIAQYSSADAIVVLGGSVGRRLPPRLDPEEIGGARLLPAAKLYRMGKSKIIIASGGNPYLSYGTTRTEADDIKEILLEYSVPAASIVLEPHSRNTAEQAKEIRKILDSRGLKTVLLVTSAFHLWRAVALFERQGIQVIPVPAGFLTSEQSHWSEFLPSARALLNSTIAVNEVLGLVWYSLRGKI